MEAFGTVLWKLTKWSFFTLLFFTLLPLGVLWLTRKVKKNKAAVTARYSLVLLLTAPLVNIILIICKLADSGEAGRHAHHLVDFVWWVKDADINHFPPIMFLSIYSILVALFVASLIASIFTKTDEPKEKSVPEISEVKTEQLENQ